jgi:hypothetical protein
VSDQSHAETAGFKYEPIQLIAPERLKEDIESGDPERMRKAIYSASTYGEDWKWAQDQCLRAIRSEHQSVRWAAAQCLGTLALLKRPIETEKVLAALKEATSDPTIAGEADMSIVLVRHALKHR